ncbi:recombinase family protein [Leptolyngbya sp. AN02str]|uniref:recombinase family protein n=1 Tax=Leptolyngbya sp. AN02str TaxID=3423363 RepID=UPI003D324536
MFESVPNASVWGQTVDRVYQDLGDRTQMQALLQDCRTNPPAYVLVQQLSDLGDTAEAMSAHLAELEALGVNLIVLDEPIEESPNENISPVRRSHLLQFIHQLQYNQRSHRIRKGHAQNRIKALPPPGRAPYGYRRGKDRYVVDRTTAPVVKAFFEHFLLYGSLRGSVRHLQQKYNKRISVSTGKRWLTSPVYRGDLVYQTGDVVPDTHASILSRQEAAQVDRLLRRNRKLPPRSASAPRSLAGLVQCGTCQSGMTVTRVTAPRREQEYLYLRPMQCPNRPKCGALPYHQILNRIIDQICDELPRAVNGADLPDIDLVKQALEREIDTKQHILTQLPNLVDTGVLDQETADLRAYKLQTETAALQAKLSQLPPVNLQAIAQVVSLQQFWLDLSESERRFYFREFIRQIQFIREGDRWDIRLEFIF